MHEMPTPLQREVTTPMYEIDLKRRDLLRKTAIGVGAGALALAAIKPALAETVLTDSYIETGETKERLAKSATVVIGKSGAVDYLTTDYVSDDACIQAAIDYLNGLGGGSVLIREGTYTLVSSISVYSNILISGTSPNKTILVIANSISDTSNIINSNIVGGNSFICLKNLTIDGNYSNQTSGVSRYGINFEKVSNSSIDNCVLKNVGTSDTADIGVGANLVSCDKCIISNNNVTNNQHYGVILWESNDCILNDNHCFANVRHGFGGSGNNRCIWIANTAKENFDQGFWFRNLNHCIIANNTIFGKSGATSTINGITLKRIAAETTSECKYNVVSNNALHNITDTTHTSSGIYLLEHTYHNNITNNSLFNCDNAFQLVNAHQTNISNNVVVDSLIADIIDIDGISYGNKFTDNLLTGCKRTSIEADGYHLTIQNNLIYDAGNETDNTYYGIYYHDRNYVLLSGNHIFSDEANKPKSGIYLSGDFCEEVTVKNNQLYSSNLAFDKSATFGQSGHDNILMNNTGFNPVGNFTAPSVPASTVNYTNAYGYPCQVQVYGGTVTEIDIDDIATGLTSGIFIIPPGGTINITYSAVPSWRWWGL